MSEQASTLVVKITCGPGADRTVTERFHQGLTVAATALAAGAEVSLWLTGDGVLLATPGGLDGVELPHAPDPADLVAAVLAGGRVTVCTQCAARRGLTEGDLLPGAVIRGSASFVEEVLAPATRALVY